MGTISIETPVIQDDSKQLTIADTLMGPDTFQVYFQNQTVTAALDALSEKERYLIIECVVKHRRQKEVGEEFGISQSYISRLVRKAKKKMKKAAIAQGWEG
jgi:RNA polymerase sigma factor (sigma-70 family)